MIKFKYYLIAARPKQWIKNLIVFSAPLFAYQLTPKTFFESLIAFIIFCIVSSGIYFLNDSIDYEKDKIHPKKKFRPIAADFISRKNAIKFSFILITFCILFSLYINKFLGLIIFLYCLIQILYCISLKEKPLLDIYCISSGFLLRALAGGAISGIRFSPWFMLTVGLLALFLAIEKRKAELRFFLNGGSIQKKVLKIYSLPLLMRLENLVSTASFITYSLWASGPTLNGAKTSWMLITIPFILYGIFRYQLLSDPEKSSRYLPNDYGVIASEAPEEVLLKDKGMQINLITWFLITLTILKFTN